MPTSPEYHRPTIKLSIKGAPTSQPTTSVLKKSIQPVASAPKNPAPTSLRLTMPTAEKLAQSASATAKRPAPVTVAKAPVRPASPTPAVARTATAAPARITTAYRPTAQSAPRPAPASATPATPPTTPMPECVPVQIKSCPPSHQESNPSMQQCTISKSDRQSVSNTSEHLTFTRALSIVCDILGPECRGFMWTARPLLWFGALACAGFAISAVLQFLHIIWWTDGSDTASALLNWLVYTSIPAVLGIIFTVVALPRDDSVHCWRLFISFILIAAGVLYGFLQGWFASPDVLLDRWLLNRHAFAWLPECIAGCGAVWIMAGFFGIIVKLCFWPKYPPDFDD